MVPPLTGGLLAATGIFIAVIAALVALTAAITRAVRRRWRSAALWAIMSLVVFGGLVKIVLYTTW
jgi:hypothetical protein